MLYLVGIGVNWWLPENIIDEGNFIAVGSMHKFSYLGGLIGLIAAKSKIENKINSSQNASRAHQKDKKL